MCSAKVELAKQQMRLNTVCDSNEKKLIPVSWYTV